MMLAPFEAKEIVSRGTVFYVRRAMKIKLRSAGFSEIFCIGVVKFLCNENFQLIIF